MVRKSATLFDLTVSKVLSIFFVMVFASGLKAQSDSSQVMTSFANDRLEEAAKPERTQKIIAPVNRSRSSFWRLKLQPLVTMQNENDQQLYGGALGFQQIVMVDRMLSFSWGTMAYYQKITQDRSRSAFSRERRRMVTIDQQLEGEMIYLDIPVSASINFLLGEIPASFTAGFSNIFYLREQYSRNDFQDGEFKQTLDYQFGVLDHLDFMGTVNFSFAVKVMEVNGLMIGLEPEYRLPVKSLASEAIEFGSFGLNLLVQL